MGDSKKQGIYILGNDKVIEDTVALAHSLRRYTPSYPVKLIPYNKNHQRLAHILLNKFGIEKFDNQSLFKELERYSQIIHGKSISAFRKFACWFGPFDEFIFFDSDIIVFQDQKDIFDLLTKFDLVYCGDGRDTEMTTTFFSERIRERNLFSEQQLSEELFTTGFFASKKNALGYTQLTFHLEEAANVSDIFLDDVLEQPVLTYVILKTIRKKADLRKFPLPDDALAIVPSNQIVGDKVYKVYKGQALPVRYIHWLSCSSTPSPNRPYINVWLKYRYPGKFGLIQRQLVRLQWLVGRAFLVITDFVFWKIGLAKRRQ